MLQRFIATFMAGLFALLPLLITLAVVSFIVGKVNAWLGPGSRVGGLITGMYPNPTVSYLASLVAVVALITLVGHLARRALGRRIAALFNWIIARIPFFNKVYSSVEQVVGLVKREDGDAASALSNVVMAQVANVRVLGMLASPDPVVILGVPHYVVYLPSTPIPASGQNLLVPCTDVQDVDVSVEELTKILLSLGSLGPGIMRGKPALILPGGV
jgi:uncharacterized membrane protein